MNAFKFRYMDEVVKHTEHDLWIGKVIGFAVTLGGSPLYVCQQTDTIETMIFVSGEDNLMLAGDFSSYPTPPQWSNKNKE
jgi:hypothetical protein